MSQRITIDGVEYELCESTSGAQTHIFSFRKVEQPKESERLWRKVCRRADGGACMPNSTSRWAQFGEALTDYILQRVREDLGK